MGDKINLSEKESLEKVQGLVDSASICLFVTNSTVTPLTNPSMSTQRVDDDGTLWFFSPASSNKNKEISTDRRVQLFYSNDNKSEYLSIKGVASVIRDKVKARELWTANARSWFTEGIDDPELTLVRVRPQNALYWDTRNNKDSNNKMVSLLKMIAGAMTGKRMDGGVEGSRRLN